MGIVFRNIIRDALVLGLVGAAIAVTLPYILTAFGLYGTVGAALTAIGGAGATTASAAEYLGLYFGLFGALNAAIAPALKWVFDGGKTETSPQARTIIVKPEYPDFYGPQQAQEKTKFREYVQADRQQNQLKTTARN